MGNLIYILSMITATVWLIAYFMLNSISPMIHLLIIAAFIGTLASLLVDNENSTINNNKNLNV